MFSVIFEVRPGDGRKDAYLEHARLLRRSWRASMASSTTSASSAAPGRAGCSRTRPGGTKKSVVRWRTHAGHHLTQSKGRTEVFSDYHLRVGEVTADSHPPAGHPVREQRFDATRSARRRSAPSWRVMPGTTALPSDAESLLPALGINPRANGLVAWDAFRFLHESGQGAGPAVLGRPGRGVRPFIDGGHPQPDRAGHPRLRHVRPAREPAILPRRARARVRGTAGNGLELEEAVVARQDSNLQPDRYERSALTIELQAQAVVQQRLAGMPGPQFPRATRRRQTLGFSSGAGRVGQGERVADLPVPRRGDASVGRRSIARLDGP